MDIRISLHILAYSLHNDFYSWVRHLPITFAFRQGYGVGREAQEDEQRQILVPWCHKGTEISAGWGNWLLRELVHQSEVPSASQFAWVWLEMKIIEDKSKHKLIVQVLVVITIFDLVLIHVAVVGTFLQDLLDQIAVQGPWTWCSIQAPLWTPNVKLFY